MVKQVKISLAIGFLILQIGTVSADTLLIQSVEKNASVARPDRGTSMIQVENQYGQPSKKHSAIGEPPITKWTYSGITVYFEHAHVIHAVVNRTQ